MAKVDEAPPFLALQEDDKSLNEHVSKCGAAMLCIIAPFIPLRVAPRRLLSASFSLPDEFVLEDFIDKVMEQYPEKKDRPPLHLLIHSPGGRVSSSYTVATVLRDNFDEIIGFVPHIAASGATNLALACNKLVMGNISQFSGINPSYETDQGTVSALSVVRAFRKLQEDIGTKDQDEVSYPYMRLTESITAEKFDEAIHTLTLVEKYTRELMHKAGYEEPVIKKTLQALLYDVEVHEEVFRVDDVKKLGLKAEHFRESSHNECWKVAKHWLRKYYLQPSPAHFIRYSLPKNTRKSNQKHKKHDAPRESVA